MQTALERAVEAVKVGVPLFVVRNAHPELVIRDTGVSYKFIPKGNPEEAIYLAKDDCQFERVIKLKDIWRSLTSPDTPEN